ncbi:MAG: UDP-N-acetylmuramate dehydrogenase, partial [Ginsengibacter sp.]
MRIQQNYPLKNYNTFGLNVYAQSFAEFDSVDTMEFILLNAEETKPKMILGGGSNILFTEDYPGLILKNNIVFIKNVLKKEGKVLVKVGAGVNWHEFVLDCVKNNYGGIENLSLIPGNVGASPMQNIGAYGVEIKDVFHELEAYDLIEKEVRKFSASDCEFGYRESVFKRKYKGRFVILNVTFALNTVPVFNTSYGAIEQQLELMNVKELSVQAISDAVIAIRTSKLPDPENTGNAGSFFKNPVVSTDKFQTIKDIFYSFSNASGVQDIPFYKIGDDSIKIPAAWLIEQCGWKGYRKGDAGCYDKQALVLINYGNA